ncbi:MAG: UDP-forming cellulose synthase catalytic subunit [Verrucomicrobiae bacterium]|nr:UDP-forming cellulose synthase catalytic subunit [Verrucomicrobiae bacterium]MCP5539657.1 UDP-forming cellulose synthase catalytic subunit [Akkermansiaceae bacterium]MCP5549395.1 UDP-forming cellulose synthase catalytic subunit [Akkermansiaceae bacterium]
MPDPSASTVGTPLAPETDADLLRRRLFFAWLIGLAGIFALGSIPVDAGAHLSVSWTVVVFLWFARWFEWRGIPRFVVLFAALYLAARYLIWRSTNTLGFTDPVSHTAALLLFGAEVYGISIMFLGAFINGLPRERPVLPEVADTDLPTVDIFIPTYNESAEVIETTLIAATRIDYPAEKLRVYLLDDGGTEQKRNSSDPRVAGAALDRGETLRLMCRRVGANYRTRAKNERAKAGNLNAAFADTDGDLVLVLDCDHVPTEQILRETAPYFVGDAKLFLVQTPHFFINEDPVERNLDSHARMPAESEMFYSVVQRGLDFWESSFFCGSAALLRRRCLEEVGGFMGDTITEDAETSIMLHAKGYKSLYVPKPLIAGLLPETLRSFVTQRIRWAQGMVQIFVLKNPLLLRGLKPWQRLCYFNNCYFWFFPYARLMFLLAPLLFLLFGLKIYNANSAEILAYSLPQVLVAFLFTDFLFGKVRWSFISDLYELLQSLYTLPAIVGVLMKPRAPVFNVTPKGEQSDRDFVSPLGVPFYFLALLTAVALGMGFWRLANWNTNLHVILITMVWAAANLVLLLAAVGIAFERRQRRACPRIPVEWRGEIENGRMIAETRVHDISATGMRIEVPWAAVGELKKGDRVSLRVETGEGKPEKTVRGVLQGLFPDEEEEEMYAGILFDHRSIDEAAEKVSLIYGDSDLWVEMQERRGGRRGILSSLFYLARLGMIRALENTAHGVGLIRRNFRRRGGSTEVETLFETVR